MKKITTRQLEAHFEWLNEHMETFNAGYADYLHDKWLSIEDNDKEGISLFTLTATAFNDGKSMDKLCEHLFDFTIAEQQMLAFFYNTKYEWDVNNLSLKQYKRMFIDLIGSYTNKLMDSVKKNKAEQTLLNAKHLLYKDTYKHLSIK